MISFMRVLATNQSGVFERKVVCSGSTAQETLQVAMTAVMGLAGEGAAFVSASDYLARPIDYVLPAAISPDTDGPVKTVYSVQFQAGSGPNGTTLQPVNIVSFSRTHDGVVTSAEFMALSFAASSAQATANGIQAMGTVDIDLLG